MKNKLLNNVILGLILSASCLVNVANATLILSNTCQTTCSGFGGSPDSADGFMTGDVGLDISSIDILWNTGNGGTLNRVGIFSEDSGLPSLTQIGGWFTSGLSTTSNTMMSYTGNLFLNANTTYWMVVDIFDNSRVAWNRPPSLFSDISSQGASIIVGSAYGNDLTGSWSHDSANLVYSIHGTVNDVPEPSTLAIFALGMIGLASRRFKKQS